MQIQPFKLERYFALHEFTARHLLSASDCESLTLPELLAYADDETRGLWDNLWLGYTESPGHPLLRGEIAGQYDGLSAGEVLVAAPEEAIFIAMQALLGPGDEVIVTWPAYQSLWEVAAAAGAQVVPWPLRPAERGWRLDMNDLSRLITPRTRLLVVNFPHNPTGFLPSSAEWQRIVELARRHDLYLFSDEMYRLLEPAERLRLPSGCESYEKAITLSGLSKSYGLPGLRIGWLASHDADFLARCLVLKDYTTICASAPSEILGIIALRSRGALVARNRAIVDHNMEMAAKFFEERGATFNWLPPTAGPVAFPELATGQPVGEWCAEMLSRHGVMVVPAEMFDYEGNNFRVGLGRSNFREALAHLAL